MKNAMTADIDGQLVRMRTRNYTLSRGEESGHEDAEGSNDDAVESANDVVESRPLRRARIESDQEEEDAPQRRAPVQSDDEETREEEEAPQQRARRRPPSRRRARIESVEAESDDEEPPPRRRRRTKGPQAEPMENPFPPPPPLTRPSEYLRGRCPLCFGGSFPRANSSGCVRYVYTFLICTDVVYIWQSGCYRMRRRMLHPKTRESGPRPAPHASTYCIPSPRSPETHGDIR